jgi:uncharacterized membrane protein
MVPFKLEGRAKAWLVLTGVLILVFGLAWVLGFFPG